MEFIGLCCINCKYRNKDSFRNFGKCSAYVDLHKVFYRTIIPNYLGVGTWCYFKEKKG
jgi:hypothetical protein